MSKKYETTKIFKTNISILLIQCLIALHALAAIAVFLTPLFFVYKIALLIAVLISLHLNIREELISKKYNIRHSSIGWEISGGKSDFSSIEILPSTVITPYLLVLHFKQHNQAKQTILIGMDALNGDEYRKLIVALRIFGLKKDGR